jgi:hypothetical protein
VVSLPRSRANMAESTAAFEYACYQFLLLPLTADLFKYSENKQTATSFLAGFMLHKYGDTKLMSVMFT